MGVIPFSATVEYQLISIPHTRGGDPHREIRKSSNPDYSLHAWGCASDLRVCEKLPPVFPTFVGVSRSSAGQAVSAGCIPHLRGAFYINIFNFFVNFSDFLLDIKVVGFYS